MATLLFPCPYGIDHMRTLNEVLAGRFLPLLERVPYARWKASRTKRRNMLKCMYARLRKSNIDGVFFTNLLADATPEIKEKFPNVRILGYVHGTNLAAAANPLAKSTHLNRERRIYAATDAIFVGSRYAQHLLSEAFPDIRHKVFVVGFPLAESHAILDAKRGRVVLYNHRFDRNKQPLQLIALKKLLPQFSFVATSPNFDPFTIGKLKKAGIRVYVNPQPAAYEALLDSAMFQVSFARHEMFGVATQRALLHGAFTLAPKRASYKELLSSEMLYGGVEELVERITQYANDADARLAIVQEAQKTSQRRFSQERWIAKVEKCLGKI